MNIEQQYLNLAKDVIDNGDPRVDRTKVGTHSKFGAMMRHDGSDGTAPIITTKQVFWKTSVREMLWFLTGGTNIRQLLEVGVRIWSDWPYAKYIEQTGDNIDIKTFEARIMDDQAFADTWGDLGPVYGSQWREWLDEHGQKHDQISDVLDLLINSPSSRRILFHAWNVPKLNKMALPPCHLLYQYHVTSDGKLNSLMFQRSCDMFLGLPFNLCGQFALQSMLAQQAGLEMGELIWMGGDTHVYTNHFDQFAEQAKRELRPLPKLTLKSKPASLFDYSIDDFVIEGYDPHPNIKAPVAV